MCNTLSLIDWKIIFNFEISIEAKVEVNVEVNFEVNFKIQKQDLKPIEEIENKRVYVTL